MDYYCAEDGGNVRRIKSLIRKVTDLLDGVIDLVGGRRDVEDVVLSAVNSNPVLVWALKAARCVWVV